MQTITSKMTSINSSRLPAIYNKINWEMIKKRNWSNDYKPTVVDYGCGKYTEHIEEFLKSKGFNPTFYDPYWNPIDIKYRFFDIAICSNVLNVINDDREIHKIHLWLKNHSIFHFISIYEGDRSRIPKETKKDCFQRNLPTSAYLTSNERVKNKIITNQLSITKNFII